MNATEAMKSLKSSNATVQLAAAEWLAQNPSEASPATVLLAQLVSSDNSELAQWSSSALEELGTPPTNLLDEIATLLKSSANDTVYWASTLLGRAGAGAKPYAAQLAAIAKNHANANVRKRAEWAVQKCSG